jgi:hypothetical protein
MCIGGGVRVARERARGRRVRAVQEGAPRRSSFFCSGRAGLVQRLVLLVPWCTIAVSDACSCSRSCSRSCTCDCDCCCLFRHGNFDCERTNERTNERKNARSLRFLFNEQKPLLLSLQIHAVSFRQNDPQERERAFCHRERKGWVAELNVKSRWPLSPTMVVFSAPTK